MGPGRWGALAAIAVAGVICIAAPSAGAAGRCHPQGKVLAQHGAVVFWSSRGLVGGKLKTRVYACSGSSGHAQLAASGSRYMAPKIRRLQVAGHFAAFILATNDSSGCGCGNGEELYNLVVFDLKRGRRELTDYDGCTGGPTEGCDLAGDQYPVQYAVASNGWIAEAWTVTASGNLEQDMEGESGDVGGDVSLVATADGKNLYSIDFGATISALKLSGKTLSWTSDLGGSSSTTLGPDLIPPATPQSLSACQLVSAADVRAVLGANSGPTGQCTYTGSATPSMTLTVGLQTGQSASQQSSAEDALDSANWDFSMSSDGGFQGAQMTAPIAGNPTQQLDAFLNGAELQLDLSQPGASAPGALAWLADVAFERLFGIPVTRAN